MKILLAAGLGFLADVPALRARLQRDLDLLRAERSFPGATLGVALDGGESFALATGLADREKATPMAPDAILLQGSVGKTYVAAVALQLADEGKLDLDARIANYVGDADWFERLPNSADITVRMLLNHTSGLVRYEFQPAFTRDLTANPDKTWRPAELLEYILGTAAPFHAGAGWEYSDTNYIVLGLVVEKIAAARLEHLIRDRLLRPLQLARTTPSDRRRIEGLSPGYAGAENPFGGVDAMLVDGTMVINPQFEWAGGGYASSAEDLARWMRALQGGRVVDPVRLGEARRGVDAPALGVGVKYGLGVIVLDTPSGTAYGHSGFFPGYCAEAYAFPRLHAAIALQINSSDLKKMGETPRAMLVRLAASLGA